VPPLDLWSGNVLRWTLQKEGKDRLSPRRGDVLKKEGRERTRGKFDGYYLREGGTSPQLLRLSLCFPQVSKKKKGVRRFHKRVLPGMEKSCPPTKGLHAMGTRQIG